MAEERTRLVAALRCRFDAYRLLPQQERDRLDEVRLIPIKETEELFEQAMRGDELTTWPGSKFRLFAWREARRER